MNEEINELGKPEIEENLEEKKRLNVNITVAIVIIGLLLLIIGFRIYDTYNHFIGKNIMVVDDLILTLIQLGTYAIAIIICLFIIFSELYRIKTGNKNFVIKWLDNASERNKLRKLEEEKEEKKKEDEEKEEPEEEDFFNHSKIFIIFFALVIFTITFFGAINVKFDNQDNLIPNINNSFSTSWNNGGQSFMNLFSNMYSIGQKNSEFFYYFYFFILGWFIYYSVVGYLISLNSKQIKEIYKDIKLKLKERKLKKRGIQSEGGII